MTTCQRPLSTTLTTSFSTNTISNSASTVLSGTKWRKGLARLSKKWKPSRHCSPLSATAAAAATEKLIRRPTAAIQTEDLTASQFAYMAGIKIKRGRNHQEEENDDMLLCEFDETEEDTEDDSDNDYTTHMVPVSLDHRQRRHLTTKMGTTKMQHGSISGMTSWSYSSSTSTNRFPPIWDVRFWQQQEQSGDESHPKKSKSSPITGSLMSSSNSHCSDLSTAESISTTDTTLSTKPRVFHKGRFQIVLGGDKEDHCAPMGEPLVRTTSDVVEWRRKRTMTH